VKFFDSSLSRSGQRWKVGSAEDEVSFGVSVSDSALVQVGRSGRRVSFGSPTATAFATGKRGNGNGNGNGNSGNGSAKCKGQGQGSTERRVVCASVGVVVSNRLTFGDVFGDGGSLVYDVGGSVVKERVVLESAPEAGRVVEFRFPLLVEGVQSRLGTDGGVEFFDGTGLVFRIPPGFAWDSRGRRGSDVEVAIGASVSKVKFLLEDGGSTLVVKADERWLADPVREYPVSIDPTIEIGRGAFNTISNRLAPGAGGTGQVLNGGFEQGFSPWNVYNGSGVTNVAVYDNASLAQSGSKYLSTNTNAPGGSVYQDVAVQVGPMKPVTVSMWVRSETPSASGTICAFLFPSAAGAVTQSGCTNVAPTSSGWKRYEVVAESGNGMSTGPCDTRREFQVTDTPGLNTTSLQFPIREIPPSGGTSRCLTRSGTNLTFASCGSPIGASQLWYDKKSAPRTDPCASLAAAAYPYPKRIDLAGYPYNAEVPTAADVARATVMRLVAAAGNQPGPLHHGLASKSLFQYLNSSGDLVLPQDLVKKVITAGRYSAFSRTIPKLILADVLQASNGLFDGSAFATVAPSVTAGFGREGKSRSGRPADNGLEVGLGSTMSIFPGWFRVVSPDTPDPDYPSAAEDIYYGMGSFDLRVSGKMLSGYRCFTVSVYDRFMFAETGLTAGGVWEIMKKLPKSVQDNGPITDNQVARLHRTGLARNFDIFGEWSTSCFVKPGETTGFYCPGIAGRLS
jgi:hypothetical protein